MQGNPVLPIITRKVPSKSGTAASWNEIIESGVIVNPRSLNIEAAVKNPLESLSALTYTGERILRTTRPLIDQDCQYMRPTGRFVQSKGETQSIQEYEISGYTLAKDEFLKTRD